MPSLRVLHYLLLTTAMVAAQDAHDGHDGMESQHAFTLDCAATAALATAEGTLNSASCEATESSCEAMSDAGGTGTMMMVCQTAYFVLQAHHDFCDHDTLSEAQEGLVHTFEAACHSCTISRPYDSAVRECVVPANCDDPAPAIATFNIINASSMHHQCIINFLKTQPKFAPNTSKGSVATVRPHRYPHSPMKKP